jgi:hypothetical protein
MEKAKNKIIVYQGKTGAIEISIDTSRETFLLTQQQVAEIFDVQKAAISRHAKNIFLTGELDKKATVSILETVQREGEREVIRKVEYYNLDLVLSVGYRINSKKATKFRQWATKVLRNHVAKGYTINPARVKKNDDYFLEAVDKVKMLLPLNIKADTGNILELVKAFADTWLSLSAYDKGVFQSGKITKNKVAVRAEDLIAAIAEFKINLLKHSEATEIFAKERSAGTVEGILGNIFQSFRGKELYQGVEEKAAHLLYFMVKNHPFIDGNKRCGTFSFI